MSALVSSAMASAEPAPSPAPLTSPPAGTFRIAVEAIQHVPGLTRGVRRNLRHDLSRCAEAVSPRGLDAEVHIPAVAEWIDRMSPAELGFKHPGSFAAFRSNVWRALKLTGHPVPVSRYAPAELSDPWAALQAKITDRRMRKKLSRFVHFASQRGWSPAEITEAHLQEFRLVLAATCLQSKAEKTFRETVRAWNRAIEIIAGWPSTLLDCGVRHDWRYGLPWSDLPASYRGDVDAFINHFDFDSLGPVPGGGLHSRTKANYREGLRRAASILVRLGVKADSIASLREVVEPIRVRQIIEFLWDRNGEKGGGHAAFMAFLLLMVARDHVHAHTDELRRLFWKTADTRFGKMADRTWDWLIPFGDPTVLDEFKNLPDRLVDGTLGRPIDISTAKTVRLALFLAFQFETALWPCKVVALDLVRDVIPSENADEVRLKIPGHKLNHQPDFEWSLTPTKRIWRLYVERYRAMHLKTPCTWLFPRADGTHWTEGAAYVDMRDVCDRHLGVAVTPQLVRALIGKIIFDHDPDGYLAAAQVLRIKPSSALAYFEAVRTKARSVHHGLLENGSDGVWL